MFFVGHQCESSEMTDVYYILIGAFFIKRVLRISPPTLQRLILSATEISCVRNTTPEVRGTGILNVLLESEVFTCS